MGGRDRAIKAEGEAYATMDRAGLCIHAARRGVAKGIVLYCGEQDVAHTLETRRLILLPPPHTPHISRVLANEAYPNLTGFLAALAEREEPNRLGKMMVRRNERGLSALSLATAAPQIVQNSSIVLLTRSLSLPHACRQSSSSGIETPRGRKSRDTLI
jgi:hypothetical protein